MKVLSSLLVASLLLVPSRPKIPTPSPLQVQINMTSSAPENIQHLMVAYQDCRPKTAVEHNLTFRLTNCHVTTDENDDVDEETLRWCIRNSTNQRCLGAENSTDSLTLKATLKPVLDQWYSVEKVNDRNDWKTYCNQSENRTVRCDVTCHGRIDNKKICNQPQKYRSDPVTFWAYLGIRILLIVTASVTMVIFEAIMITMMKEYNADYALQRTWGTIAACIAPPISGVLIDLMSRGKDYTDFSIAFYICAVAWLSSSVLVAFIKGAIKLPTKNVHKELFVIVKDPEVILFLIATTIAGAVWGFTEGFFFLFLQSLDSPKYLMGLTHTMSGIASLPMLLVAGIIIDRAGHANTLALCISVYVIRLIGYSLISDPFLCLPFEALEMFTTALFSVATITYAGILAPHSVQASMQGMVGGLTHGVGKALGSLYGGFMVSYKGYPYTYQSFAIICLVTSISYFCAFQFWLKHRQSYKDRVIRVAEEKKAFEETELKAKMEKRALKNGTALACAETVMVEKPKKLDKILKESIVYNNNSDFIADIRDPPPAYANIQQGGENSAVNGEVILKDRIYPRISDLEITMTDVDLGSEDSQGKDNPSFVPDAEDGDAARKRSKKRKDEK